MRFKNYRNSYTKDNRIYSKNDVANMTVKDVFGRKQELMAQNRSIGLPSDRELMNSENVVWVESYTRDDGTEVRAHWRSKPDGVASNNFSQGTPTGGASNIDESKQIEQVNDSLNNNITLEATITKEEKIKKMMYPDEIAGVKRGEPKTFEQMTQQVINPKLYSEEDVEGDYSKNCQSCTVAAELVIRGYDVEAGPYSTPEAQELGKFGKSAYLDPETGEECVPDIIYYNEISCNDYLEKNVKQGERYELSFNTPTESGNKEFDKENEYRAHVVLITRNNENQLEYYDPQNGRHLKGEQAKKYIDTWFQYEHTVLAPPRILRIDDKALNLKYVNAVVRKRS